MTSTEFDRVADLPQLARHSPALLFGHADADGHLATEQTRRNLKRAGVKVSQVVISPETASFRFWTDYFPRVDFVKHGLVVTVDLAFSFKNPRESLSAVVKTVRSNPSTQFIILDHHPLLNPNQMPANLRLVSVDRVYDCCLGIATDDFMAVASICDGGVIVSSGRARESHMKRAVGLRRAAAEKQLNGDPLLRLLRQKKWSFFEALADEPAEYHRTVRGRRSSRGFASPLLQAALSS